MHETAMAYSFVDFDSLFTKLMRQLHRTLKLVSWMIRWRNNIGFSQSSNDNHQAFPKNIGLQNYFSGHRLSFDKAPTPANALSGLSKLQWGRANSD
jgi:hypothetical protein